MARTATAQARTEVVAGPFVPRPVLRLIWSAESPDAPVALEPGAAPHIVAYHRGYMCGTAGETAKSLAFYHQAIKLRPDFADAYSNVGYLLGHAGKTRWAIAAYHKATLVDPASAWAHDGLGNWLREAGRSAEAAVASGRATALRPDWAQAHANLGGALWDVGQFQAAIDAYRKAIELQPDFPEAFHGLGLALRKTGAFTAAAEALRAAVDLRPDYIDALHMLGAALGEARQFLELAAAFRRVTALRPDFAEAHFGLGLSLVEADQIPAAIEAFREGLKFKYNEDYREYIARLVKVYESNRPGYNPQLMGHTAEQLSVIAKSGLSATELQEAIDNYKAAKAQFTAHGKPSRSKAEPRPKSEMRGTNIKLSPSRVVAVIEDFTLGRLHRRYTELLAKIELPPDGFKSLKQARAGGLLSSTFNNLQARRAKVGLEPLPKDDRVAEAKRLSVAFYRHKARPPSPRRGRMTKGAALG